MSSTLPIPSATPHVHALLVRQPAHPSVPLPELRAAVTALRALRDRLWLAHRPVSDDDAAELDRLRSDAHDQWYAWQRLLPLTDRVEWVTSLCSSCFDEHTRHDYPERHPCTACHEGAEYVGIGCDDCCDRLRAGDDDGYRLDGEAIRCLDCTANQLAWQAGDREEPTEAELDSARALIREAVQS